MVTRCLAEKIFVGFNQFRLVDILVNILQGLLLVVVKDLSLNTTRFGVLEELANCSSGKPVKIAMESPFVETILPLFLAMSSVRDIFMMTTGSEGSRCNKAMIFPKVVHQLDQLQ